MSRTNSHYYQNDSEDELALTPDIIENPDGKSVGSKLMMASSASISISKPSPTTVERSSSSTHIREKESDGKGLQELNCETVQSNNGFWSNLGFDGTSELSPRRSIASRSRMTHSRGQVGGEKSKQKSKSIMPLRTNDDPEDSSVPESEHEPSTGVSPESSPEPNLESRLHRLDSSIEWTDEDEQELQNGRAEEQSLWIQLAEVFAEDDSINCPKDLLPDGQDFDDTCFVHGSKTNLTKNFCEALTRLIRCSVFAEQPAILRYAIHHAMYHRLKDEGFQRPENYRVALGSSRTDRVGQLFAQELPERALEILSETNFRDVLEKVLNNALGEDVPQHGTFMFAANMRKIVSDMPAIRGKHQQPGSGVALRDLQAVAKTWDTYSVLGRNQYKSVQQANENKDRSYNLSDKNRKAEYLNSKKAWILDQRRKDLQSPPLRNTKRLRSGSDGPATKKGKSVASDVKPNSPILDRPVRSFTYHPTKLNIFDYSRVMPARPALVLDYDPEEAITSDSFSALVMRQYGKQADEEAEAAKQWLSQQ